MATNTQTVGTVTAVVGQVKVTGADGVVRMLGQGDKVYATDVLETAVDGAVHVRLENGATVNCGPGASLNVAQNLLDLPSGTRIALDGAISRPLFDTTATAAAPGTPQAPTVAGQHGEIAALQAQIAAGADPSKVAEATAAGGAPGAGGADGSGGTPVILDQADSLGLVTSGFQTQGVGAGEGSAPTQTALLQTPNLRPTNSGDSVRVSEEGLEGGLPDSTGDADTTNARAVSGDLSISDPEGDVLTVTFGIPPETLTSGGEIIVWRLSDDGKTLLGVVVEDGGESKRVAEPYERVVVEAIIDDSGHYDVILRGPIDHPDTPLEDDLAFRIPVTVTDALGASTTADLTVTVEDDSPIIDGGEGYLSYSTDNFSDLVAIDDEIRYDWQPMVAADEDDTANGNHDWAGGDDYPWPQYTSLPIQFGADGPADDDAVVFDTTGIVDQNGNPLASGGEPLSYEWDAGNNRLVGYVGEGEDAEVIFYLVVDYVGQYGTSVHIELVGALDHPIATGPDGAEGTYNAPEDNLVFNVGYTATDFDGDTAQGQLQVNIDDDSPTLAVGEGECRFGVKAMVHEEGMRFSTGDLSDGNQFPGNTDADESVSAAGSLRQLYSFGADGPGEFVMLTDVSGLPQLYSNGYEVSYSVVDNVLTATAASGESEYDADRVVFTLTLNADGSWSFDLQDQLDHVTGNGENTMLRDGVEGSVYSIDFSSLIQAKDGDGDEAPALPAGTFMVSVTDDVPVHSGPEGGIQAMVQEDGMSIATGDLSEGNKESGGTNTDDDTSSALFGSLASLASAGADENLTFGIKLDEGDLPPLYSNGYVVNYAVQDNVLTATAGGGEGDEDRVVFTLTINADGSWSFELVDQLDHVSGDGENTALRAGEEGSVPYIDFSRLILVSDADGDELALLNQGDFTITVQDDVPTANDNANNLTEDSEAAVTGNVLDDDVFGADSPVSVLAIRTGAEAASGTAGTVGVELAGEYGNLTLQSNGSYTYTRTADLQGLDDGENVQDVFTYTIRDADGDIGTAQLTITINGVDDPMVVQNDADSFNEDQVQTVVVGVTNVLTNDSDPDTSDNPLQVQDTAAQNVYLLDVDGNLTSTVAGTITFGADGTYSLALNDAYKAQADALNTGESFKVGVVYTTVNQDSATADATLRITINGNTDTEASTALVVGSNVHDNPDSSTPHRVDTSGTTTSGIVDAGVLNDVLIGDAGGKVTIVQPGQDYSIALICDMSGSMSGGKDALLRAALENFVNTLVPFSDGHINIGLISFGWNATLRLDLTDLNAGNKAALISQIQALLPPNDATNYEAAFTQAKSWFDAQVSGGFGSYNKLAYFLTDGDPTTYNGDFSGTGGATNYLDMAQGNSAWNALLAAHGTVQVHGIGIGSGATLDNLRYFDNTAVTGTATFDPSGNPGPGFTDDVGQPLLVTTAAQLTSALVGGSSTDTANLVGNDVISGGDGNDAILGDSIYSGGVDQGWAAYVAAHPGLTAEQMRADIHANLTSGSPTYAQEGTVGGNDTIDGGAGNDVIFGQGGNDILVGGTGSDTLNGGSGADTFKWGNGDQNTSSAPNDIVIGFNENSGDKLDLKDLLEGAGATSEALSSYLHFTEVSGNVVIEVHSFGASGAGSSSAIDQSITLQGVSLASLTSAYGAGDANIISGLIGASKLVVD